MKLVMLALVSTIASVVNFRSTEVTVDKGLIDGLRAGDRGVVFYLISNQEREFRFDYGHAEITACGDRSCQVRTDPSLEASPGYWIDFPSAEGRAAFSTLLPILKERITAREWDSAALYLQRLEELSAGRPELEAHLEDLKELLEDARRPPPRTPDPLEAFQAAVRAGNAVEAGRLFAGLRERDLFPELLGRAEDSLLRLWNESMLEIPAQSAVFGQDREHARYFNQTPQFEKHLSSYWIDRRPTAEVGVTYTRAEEFCRNLGKRLPTEFEWELAARKPGFEPRVGLSEWTSSWYRPYPGNSEPEAEYGERFKVIRGYDDSGQFRPSLRFYLAQGDLDPVVGFRCASDPP